MNKILYQNEKKINTNSINLLINEEIIALIITNYYQPELCDSLSYKLLKSQNINPYSHEIVENNKVIHKNYGVNRVGTPFNLTYNLTQNDLLEKYYLDAAEGIETMRSYCYPALSPIDKLRLELDENFLPGATVAHFQNKKMLAGIGRISIASLSYLSEVQPHFDALPLKYALLDVQLAANIYLKVPDEGGDLELWNVSSLTPLSKVAPDWRSELPPSIKIKPRKGDLIVFNCRKPHAICAFKGDERVTAQVFIGYQKGKPLMLWN
jgi:hypothetical protein